MWSAKCNRSTVQRWVWPKLVTNTYVTMLWWCTLTEKCTNGEIRLSGSNFDRHGRVEVCLNRTWGTICDNLFNNTDASVICRQLGFSPYGENFDRSYTRIPEGAILAVCWLSKTYVHVYCNHYTTLAFFSILLTATGAIAIHGSYSESILPIFINDLNCTGSEETVWLCPHNAALSPETCNHEHDAAVVCQLPEGMIMLVHSTHTHKIINGGYYCSPKCKLFKWRTED